MTRLWLNVSGYTDAQVTAALAKSGRYVKYDYELLDNSGASKGFIFGVQAGATISYDYTAQIKRSGRLTIVESYGSDNINYGSDLLRPLMSVQMPDGGWAQVPLGVFVLSSSTRTYAQGAITRDIDLYDKTQLLLDDKPMNRYVLKGGTVYTDALTAILGQYDAAITPSSSTLQADRTWDPGTSYYDIVSDLLSGVGYNTLWFDAYGSAQCAPYVAPSDDISGWTYATNATSLIGTGVSQTVDLFAVPNVFVRNISVSSKPLLTSTFSNDSPNSPTSTVSRGRQIVDVQDANDCATQADLDARARQDATNASQVYETVDLPTITMPFHQDHDIVTISHTGLGISADYAETGWSMTLQAGAMMTHNITAVVSIDSTVNS